MKHRWKSAVLALLLAVLMCAALTGCELEEVANPYISISGGSGTDKWTTDKDGAYWTVTRTLKDEKVTKALKDDNFCLYQIEAVTATNNEDNIKQVSLQYVLKADNYWDMFDTLLDRENTLEKSADTSERRYVVVTFDYEQNGDEDKPTKVTLRYETAEGRNDTNNVRCESVYTFNTLDVNEDAALQYESGAEFDETIRKNSSTTFQRVLNSALKIVLKDDTTTNTQANIQKNITKLASAALTSANEVLDDTRTKRKADVSAAAN